MRITYYLFRKSVVLFDQVWRDPGGAPADKYDKVPLKSTVPFEAEAYLQANRFTTPDWLPFVKPYCQIAADKLPGNRSSSFILLLKVKNRIFAVTFGHGFAAIHRGRLEPDFGLKVALNTVNPKRLRSVQARNVDPTTVSKQLVVNQDSALAVFDVDFYHDLLAKLDGVPDDSDFGKRVAGADACYLSGAIMLPELGTKCEELLTHYRSRSYSKHFPFIDQVRPIRDDSLIERLDGKLLEAMTKGDTSALGLALPDVAGYERIHSYKAHHGRWNIAFDDLAAAEILDAYNADHPEATDHFDVRIDALTDDGGLVDAFTLRECAVFQVRHGQRVCVLTLNKWYEVKPDYAASVDVQVRQLPLIKAKRFLPTIRKGTAERTYNAAAADGRRLVLMDKKNIRPAGAESSIEVCDLFSRKGEFIHVKRHTRSATLSHLLAQGTVSARLFIDDRGYRDTFRKALPPALRAMVDPDKVEPSKHSVVYAISAPSSNELPSGLPFFTKVNLLFHCREIQRMGMTAKVFHIQEV